MCGVDGEYGRYDDLLEIEDESRYDDIDITDDFMFSYIMRQPDICMELLEYLLPGKRIRKVKYHLLEGEDARAEQADFQGAPETQRALHACFDKRSVRLDAYLDDGETVYAIEMQTTSQSAIAKRSRLYQAHIDVNQLSRGLHYDQLRPCFVIFICTFDPFGQGLYRYSFKNMCAEQQELALNDEAYRLFFNTTGSKGDIPPRLRELLDYMNDPKRYPVRNTQNELIHRIERAVVTAKQDEEWRRTFMMYQMKQRDAELRGERRGMAIGEQRGMAIGEQRARRARLESARKMLLRQMPMEDVIELLSLTEEDVRELMKSMN